MKRVLDKVLDAYDRRLERREEAFERVLTSNVEALANRRTLKIHLLVLGTVTLLIWVSVLFFPFDVLWAFEKVSSINDKITFTFIAIVFGIGLWLTYSLFRLKYPDLENRTTKSEPMASFADQENATRKIRVWLGSVVGAVVNLLALAMSSAYWSAKSRSLVPHARKALFLPKRHHWIFRTTVSI